MTLDVIRILLAALCLTAACITDIKKREIPNLICAATALTAFIGFQPERFWGLAVAAFFVFIALFIGFTSGGDIKLFAALSLHCGLWGGIALLMLSHIAMLLFYLAALITAKIQNSDNSTARKAYPFAPFLFFGFIVVTAAELLL